MFNRIHFSDLIGDVAMVQKVQIMEVDAGRKGGSLQPVLRHMADGTAGTVLEDGLRLFSGLFMNFLQSGEICQRDPVHAGRISG